MESLVDGFACLVTRDDGTFDESSGLYWRDTRFLSSLGVELASTAFDFLDLQLDPPSRRRLVLANRTPNRGVTEIPSSGADAPSSVVLVRDQSVDETGGYHEKLTLRNHSSRTVSSTFAVTFDVDFADIFEVRGLETAVDRSAETRTDEDSVTYRYSYEAASGEEVAVRSTVGFDRAPDRLEPGRAAYSVTLDPQESVSYPVTVRPDTGDSPGGRTDRIHPHRGQSGKTGGAGPDTRTTDPDGRREPGRHRRVEVPDPGPIATGNPEYDRTFAQVLSDLRALTTDTEFGPVPVAGVPWYAAVFGRDALITAYQVLHVAPSMAPGVLGYLADHQGTTTDDYSDERPGKMFHELRQGELARREMIPHSPYYGSIDASPLWVVLLHETYRWLGDEALVEDHWGTLRGVLDWIETATEDVGDDPFLYYRATDADGLDHKAWRDSANSVQFSDGRGAIPPIASAEVQGYVYDALVRTASLLREVRNDDERASEFERRAEVLRTRFDREFWLPDRDFYGAAKTADGRVVDSLTSTVGQCLWSGIVPDERAETVRDRLLSPSLFSGWGIRTTSTDDAGYDPVSYHVGSVWPHDSSLVALGLARYGFYDAAETVAHGLLEATTHFEHNRVPELFCGFDDSIAPVPYDASCTPQAWSSGAPLVLLRALFDAHPGDDGLLVGHRPGVVASDSFDPILDAWDGGAPTLWGSDTEASVYVL